MRKGALLVLGVLLLLTATAHASRSHKPGASCAPISRTASLHSFAYGAEPCAANVIPHVSVDGHPLLTADLSDHDNTATFYGQHSVVKLDQRAGRVYVFAVTTDRLAFIVVRFAPLRVTKATA